MTINDDPRQPSAAVTAIRRPPAPKRRSAGDRSATLAFWAFMAPSLIGLTVFTVIPILWGFLLSLSHAQNTIHPGHFIGLRNYTDLLTDEAFLQLTGHGLLVFAVVYRPDRPIAVSLGLALLMVNRVD